jgi:hypothetical protein
MKKHNRQKFTYEAAQEAYREISQHDDFSKLVKHGGGTPTELVTLGLKHGDGFEKVLLHWDIGSYFAQTIMRYLPMLSEHAEALEAGDDVIGENATPLRHSLLKIIGGRVREISDEVVEQLERAFNGERGALVEAIKRHESSLVNFLEAAGFELSDVLRDHLVNLGANGRPISWLLELAEALIVISGENATLVPQPENVNPPVPEPEDEGAPASPEQPEKPITERLREGGTFKLNFDDVFVIWQQGIVPHEQFGLLNRKTASRFVKLFGDGVDFGDGMRATAIDDEAYITLVTSMLPALEYFAQDIDRRVRFQELEANPPTWIEIQALLKKTAWASITKKKLIAACEQVTSVSEALQAGRITSGWSRLKVRFFLHANGVSNAVEPEQMKDGTVEVVFLKANPEQKENDTVLETEVQLEPRGPQARVGQRPPSTRQSRELPVRSLAENIVIAHFARAVDNFFRDEPDTFWTIFYYGLESRSRQVQAIADLFRKFSAHEGYKLPIKTLNPKRFSISLYEQIARGFFATVLRDLFYNDTDYFWEFFNKRPITEDSQVRAVLFVLRAYYHYAALDTTSVEKKGE